MKIFVKTSSSICVTPPALQALLSVLLTNHSTV